MHFRLILGGTRSGKSTVAEAFASVYMNVLYIATSKPNEEGMEERIKIHRDRRPDSWVTLEKYREFQREDLEGYDVVLLDCATLMLSNILLEKEDIEEKSELEVFSLIEKELFKLLEAAEAVDVDLIIVSNEVGMGLVSEHKLGNIYRDASGRMNSFLAGRADDVFFMVAGIPMKIK